MIGAMVGIGICGLVSYVGEKLNIEERTKEIINTTSKGVALTITVVTVVHFVKITIKEMLTIAVY